MKTTAFVLVETNVGKTKDVAKVLRATAAIVSVAIVTGPYDLVVQVEASDVNAIGRLVTGQVQSVPGIRRTLTMISTPL